MKAWLSFFLALMITESISQSNTSESTCPTFTCINPSTVAFLPGQTTCLLRDSETSFQLQECPPEQSCSSPYDIFSQLSEVPLSQPFSCNSIKAAVVETSLSFPGQSCAHNADCTNNNCDRKRGICIGGKSEEKCLDSSSCAVGLACFDGICKVQGTVGALCVNDFQCINSAFCSDGHCVPYLSLNEGHAISINGKAFDANMIANETRPRFRINFQCRSMVANTDGLCIAAPFFKSDYTGTPCTKNEDCELSNGDFSECECGLNEEGNKYCKRAPGDTVYAFAHKEIQALSILNAYCHTMLRFSEDCNLIADRAQKLSETLEFGEYGHRLSGLDVDSCVIELMGKDRLMIAVLKARPFIEGGFIAMDLTPEETEKIGLELKELEKRIKGEAGTIERRAVWEEEQEKLDKERREKEAAAAAEELEKVKKEHEEAEKAKQQQREEEERLKKEQQDAERKKKEQEETERKKREQEEAERKKKEHEEAERLKREKEEEERLKKEQEEAEKKKKKEEEERLQREKEETERLKREQAEKERKKKEEEEKLKRDQEEAERLKKEQEDAERKRKEEEAAAARRKKEEDDRLKREEEEAEKLKIESERLQKEHEQVERLKHEQEAQNINTTIRPPGNVTASTAEAGKNQGSSGLRSVYTYVLIGIVGLAVVSFIISVICLCRDWCRDKSSDDTRPIKDHEDSAGSDELDAGTNDDNTEESKSSDVGNRRSNQRVSGGRNKQKKEDMEDEKEVKGIFEIDGSQGKAVSDGVYDDDYGDEEFKDAVY
eukprot:TRINITY_DN6684_c0_g1_i6.p1 TRINITY_DN6684_c0_g1~~TRINITY_DN6684_c0_g1_i6.p1  ORF type:complete len:776 (+),score=160.85 TRINITY_DN6684_c0_g1_i6:209-2536(+)